MLTENLTFEQVPQAVTMLLNELSELKLMVRKLSKQPEPEPDENLISIMEACKLINVTRSTLYRYEREGKVKVYGIGARRLLKRSELINSLILKK